MTKRQKGLCSSFGCHNKAEIDLVFIGRDAKYFCGEDYVRSIGYFSEVFKNTKALDVKLKFFKGVDLYRS